MTSKVSSHVVCTGFTRALFRCLNFKGKNTWQRRHEYMSNCINKLISAYLTQCTENDISKYDFIHVNLPFKITTELQVKTEDIKLLHELNVDDQTLENVLLSLTYTYFLRNKVKNEKIKLYMDILSAYLVELHY